MVAAEEVASSFGPGTHGSTFGGNPVCCAASLVVFETLLSPGFLDEVRRKGDLFAEGLRRVASGRGGETREAATRCLASGLVVNSTAGNVLRFLPPLTVTDGEIRQGLSILEESLPREGGA